MKYIILETINGIFIFLSIGILLCNLMDIYNINIGSFPLIFFICFAFPAIALFTYDILILSENSVLLNRNTEITKNNSTLTNEDRQLKYIIDVLLFILHTTYIMLTIYLSIQLDKIYYFIMPYILFLASLILLRQKLNKNIKLRRLLRNNETNNKHYQPFP